MVTNHPPRILAFTPYTLWDFHTKYEVTITAALQLRGAEVRHVRCLGELVKCDVIPSIPPPDGVTGGWCAVCRSRGDRDFGALGLTYERINDFVNSDEMDEIAQWADSLEPAEMLSAVFRNRPLGEWVTSSMVSDVRDYPLSMDRPNVSDPMRGYLKAAAITLVALERLLDDWQPTAMVLFNGRRSVTYVAYRLAQERGIRVLVHERPLSPGTIYVMPNVTCVSYKPFLDYWNRWREVPLTPAQIDIAARWLRERRYAINHPGVEMYASAPAHADIHRIFDIAPGTPIVAYMTTSMFEIMGNPEAYADSDLQSHWIETCIQWAQDNPDIALIIRVHPNVANAPSEVAYYRSLASAIPRNVQIVMPNDPLSAYDIVAAAKVVVSYASTIGLEALATGKTVIADTYMAFYGAAEGLISITKAAKLPELLSAALREEDSLQKQIGALRFIYRYFYGFPQPFDLVSVVSLTDSRLEYDTRSALLPGKDATLDRICDYVLTGNAMWSPPSDIIATSSDEELRYFQSLIANPDWLLPTREDRNASRRSQIVASIRAIPTRIALAVPGPLHRFLRAVWMRLPRGIRRAVSSVPGD